MAGNSARQNRPVMTPRGDRVSADSADHCLPEVTPVEQMKQTDRAV